MRKGMVRWLSLSIMVTVAVLILAGARVVRSAHAGAALPQNEAASSLVDHFQRTYRIDQYKELADSGAARGENIYFFKCFICHNKYTQGGGPNLKDLYKHSALRGGDPVSDDSVADQIKNGNSGMPGFGRSLADADVADVVSYLKSGTCCFEADEPPANPFYQAEAHKWPVQSGLKGGAQGTIRTASGDPLEGMKIQLIAPNGVRTTVFSNQDGKYEFPAMQAGSYTLRVSTPVPYKPYVREGVMIDKANKLDEIVLEKIPDAGGPGDFPGAMPPTHEIESQLSGEEMLWNLPGTTQEKSTFVRLCGGGCHSYQQIFRNRFDERSWRVMIDRMLHYSGNALIERRDGLGFGTAAEVETTIKWLSKVRGPESKDDPVRLFPRPSGPNTRVVITEFELPRRLLSAHDVYVDPKGNIWYTSHRTPYPGVLDPRTGIVKEYHVPLTPGLMPGTHHVVMNKEGMLWYSENWSRHLTRLDPTTGEFKQLNPDNTGFGNFGLAPDGFLWSSRMGKEIVRIDPETGNIVNRYPLTKNPAPYENILSADGRFWAGGSSTLVGSNTALILDIKSGKLLELNSGDIKHTAARGLFDSQDNAWFGGREGVFVEIVNEIDKGKGAHIRTFRPPTPYFPYTDFYDAVPDKNEEVWGGMMHGRGFVRFNSKTGQWLIYDNAEPSALARQTWIDNTTNPVTVWFVDYHTGCIVRIQPMD